MRLIEPLDDKAGRFVHFAKARFHSQLKHKRKVYLHLQVLFSRAGTSHVREGATSFQSPLPVEAVTA